MPPTSIEPDGKPYRGGKKVGRLASEKKSIVVDAIGLATNGLQSLQSVTDESSVSTTNGQIKRESRLTEYQPIKINDNDEEEKKSQAPIKLEDQREPKVDIDEDDAEESVNEGRMAFEEIANSTVSGMDALK